MAVADKFTVSKATKAKPETFISKPADRHPDGKFIDMKNPPIQRQHKIPQVYLKTFAIDSSNSCKQICILAKGDKQTRKKNIKSFDRHENFFDIKSDDSRIERVFEEMNGLLETHYPKILQELEQNQTLSVKHTSYLLQFAANMIGRSDVWRESIIETLNSDVKHLFIQHMIAHTFKTKEERENIEASELFKRLNSLSADEGINRMLMFFMSHLLERLWHFEITYFKAHADKGWFTSDNPVVMDNEPDGIEMLPKDSVLYFPLTPDYLAFIHYKKSTDTTNPFRKYESNKIHEVNDEEMNILTKTILNNASNYIICPF